MQPVLQKCRKKKLQPSSEKCKKAQNAKKKCVCLFIPHPSPLPPAYRISPERSKKTPVSRPSVCPTCPTCRRAPHAPHAPSPTEATQSATVSFFSLKHGKKYGVLQKGTPTGFDTLQFKDSSFGLKISSPSTPSRLL